MSCQQEQLIAFHRFCGFRGTTVDHTVLIAGGAAGDQRLAGTRKRPDVSDAPGQYVPHRTEAGKDLAALCREESHRGRAQPRVIPARRVPIGPPDARAPGGAGGAEPKKQFHVGVRFLSYGER